MIWHLAPNGRIGMVLANGSLSSQSGGEGEIRKNIINADLVDCIVAMPSQLFYTTQIPVSLWFLAKNKKQKGKTLFIDARKKGTMVTRKLRELTDEDIQRIADTYNAFVDGTLEDEKGFCAVVTTQEIAKQDYILTPGRYVGIEEQEDDGEPFEEKMSRLTSELSELFAKSMSLRPRSRRDWGRLDMNYKTYPIADLIDEIAMGPFGSNIKVDCFVDKGIPVLNGSNLEGFELSEKSFRYVTEEKADSLKKANAYKGDVVITHRGTLGTDCLHSSDCAKGSICDLAISVPRQV